MRLIDADTLIKDLSYLYTKNHIAVDMRAKEILTTIMEQPTAYNVDKVVEELELHSFELGTDTLPVHYVRLNEAIEIVKQGSASDDICEWKQDNMCETVYRVCGGFSTTAYQTDFEFCPYCGKKIKVVGDRYDD